MDFDVDVSGVGVHHLIVKDELIQCFACKQEMVPRAFQKHNIEVHNMLSWVAGTAPLDLNNEKFVLSLLNKVLRGKKRKVLCCDVCGEEKKSALGFFTHKQTCGKTEEEINQLRVTCEICGKSMMPVSLRPHVLSHERKNAAAEELSEANIIPEDLSVKKSRRVAATRAKSRMLDFLSDDGSQVPMKIEKQLHLYSDMESDGWDSSPRLIQTWRGFISLTGGIECLFNGCMYRADSVETVRKHLSTCEFYRSHDKRFLCNVCLLQRKDESDIAAHVQTEHESVDSDMSADMNSTSDNDHTSDDESENVQTPVNRQSRQSYRPKPSGPQRAFNKLRFLQNTVSGLGKDLEIYSAALNWTLEFRLSNYSEKAFPTLSPVKEAWSLVLDDVESYLPSTSCSVPIEFRSSIQKGAIDAPYTFSLFEGQIVDDVSTFFTGGPIWAMEWCPIPMRVCVSEADSAVECLAVSTHHNMDDTFCVSKCYSFPNIIQLWVCCSLSTESVSQAPELALALAHNCGTVWSLAWCPSGAYDCDSNLPNKTGHEWKRMGLLAAACSSGDVQVFSVPFPNQLTAHSDKKVLPVYKAEPCLRLITNFTEPSQCTRVAWYQGRGHGLVAGGFCNGMVALWDLITLPHLLWDAHHRTLRPFQCIQAHLTVISALSFNPEYEGRFFMTGSHDRSVKFWDMEDLSAPITHHKRGYVTDGVWLNLWISSITSYDDAFQHEHTNSTLHPVRDFGYKPYPLLTQNSVAWCLSYNEWINATAQGSEAGEIVVTFSSQLMIGLENEKNAIDKRLMASYTLLKKLDPGDPKQLGEVVLWQPEPKKNAKAKSKRTSKSTKSKTKQGKQAEPPQEEDDEIPASLYTPEAILQDRNPQYYADIKKSYGLCIHDTITINSNKNKLPEEARSRVRLSGRMHPTCSDFYPITSINKVAWNPNIGRFFWLATGYQCGLVRITGMHFMQNPTSKKFLSKASETLLMQ